MDNILITIPLPPISKKNSQQIFKGKNGRPFIVPSSQYRIYERDAIKTMRFETKKPKAPIDAPVNVECTFYMPTRRKVDLVNLLESALDVLTVAGVISDDNRDIVACMDGSRVFYDKENPRTEIVISKISGYEKWKGE